MKYVAVISLLFSFTFGDMVLHCVGATTVQPIIEQVAKKYQEETGISIKTSGGGSKYAIDSVASGQSEIGMTNRELTLQEKSLVSYVTIGYDTLAFIVNNDNPLSDISKKDIIEIYTGRVKNWEKFNSKDEQIYLISKNIGRGTLDTFEKYSGLFHPKNPKNSDTSKMIDASAWDAGANNDTLVWVGGIPQSIGYIPLGSATAILKNHALPIKILSLEHIYPSKQSVLDGSYPIKLELNLLFLKTNEEAQKFVLWMLQEYAQRSVEENLFIKAK